MLSQGVLPLARPQKLRTESDIGVVAFQTRWRQSCENSLMRYGKGDSLGISPLRAGTKAMEQLLRGAPVEMTGWSGVHLDVKRLCVEHGRPLNWNGLRRLHGVWGESTPGEESCGEIRAQGIGRL